MNDTKENNPMIVVTAFKKSGKYYSRHESRLKDEHYRFCPIDVEEFNKGKAKGFFNEYLTYAELERVSYLVSQGLWDSIKDNNPPVQEYSGLSCAFNGEYYYVIEVLYEDYEKGFVFFHMDKTKEAL